MFSISVRAEATAQNASQPAVQVRITFALWPRFFEKKMTDSPRPLLLSRTSDSVAWEGRLLCAIP